MTTYPFDARIVLARKDLKGMKPPIPLDVVMDAVHHAVATIPGVAGVEICYLGARAPKEARVRVCPHDSGDAPVARGHWNAFLRKEVERHMAAALAGLAQKAAA